MINSQLLGPRNLDQLEQINGNIEFADKIIQKILNFFATWVVHYTQIS